MRILDLCELRTSYIRWCLELKMVCWFSDTSGVKTSDLHSIDWTTCKNMIGCSLRLRRCLSPFLFGHLLLKMRDDLVDAFTQRDLG